MSETHSQNPHRERLQNALLAIKKLQARLDTAESAKREPIAIVGAGCRIPGGADSPEQFAQLLHEGFDAVGRLPADRFAVVPEMFTGYGNFLKDIGGFDPQFFGISPREAQSLDPQQRLLLEVSWEALEHAGQAPDALAESKTGVFLGVSVDDYAQFHLRSGNYARIDAYTCSGAALCFGAGRLSYVLGLHGPCLTVDTACSSALAAIHLACQSLRAGECDLALAGGINLILTPEVAVGMSALHALSPDGRCKAFDASADGFGRGEGCGIVVLKRVSAALAAGDNILALIRGSAINHDGPSGGLMVPNGLAQEALLRAALANAGVKPSDVQYIEAHGTGTALGDPIELEALGAVLGEGRPAARPLIVGSVKTNIGHPEAASGVIGLIKVAMALQREEIPAHLHFHQPSPHVPWDRLPIVIPTKPRPWPAGQVSRIAGVSAFGMSGTNVHLVVEEAPPKPHEKLASDVGQVANLRPVDNRPHIGFFERPLHLLRLSAKSSAALTEMAGQWERALAEHPEASFPDICYTANAGRSHFPHRMALLASTAAEARTSLVAFAEGREAAGLFSRQIERGERPKVAFLFTGQGSQYAGMGRQLYDTQPTFRAALDNCDKLLRPYLEWPLLSVLFGAPGTPAVLDETAYTQPALFALEYALAQLWRSWGVEPTAVLGYSVGEYVAACVAGVFSLEDGLKLIARRGQLMQALPPNGAMAAVFAGEAEVAAVLKPYSSRLALAAINGPAETVISGDRTALEELLRTFLAAGVKTQRLTVSHAFHSPLLEPMLDEFAQVAAQIPHAAPRIGLVSNLTGKLLTASQVGSAHWRLHARQPVQFTAGLETLYAQGIRLFVEIGPRPILSGIGGRVLTDGAPKWLPSLRRGHSDWRQMLQSLAELHLHGVRIDWAGFDRDYHRRRVPLPTYPFQRTRFWTPRPAAPAPRSITEILHPLLHRRLPLALREQVFETTLRPGSPAFLTGHRVQGNVVLPATAFLEMALAAAVEVHGPGPYALEGVRFDEALVLLEASDQTVQLMLAPEAEGEMRFEISRQVGSAAQWRLLASGRVRRGAPVPESLALGDIQTRCQHEVEANKYYDRFLEQGLEYGPGFRGIVKIHKGTWESLGQVELPEPLTEDAPAYHCHPALLDAALQVMAAAVDDEFAAGQTYIPVGIERFELRAPLGRKLWSHAAVRPTADHSGVTGDVRIADETGQVVADVRGLQVRRVQRDVKALADALYEVIWREQEPRAASNTRPRRWLILGDRTGLLPNLLPTSSPPYDGVIYLAHSNNPSPPAAALEDCAEALRLVQEIEAAAPRLFLVTRGAQPVAGSDVASPAQAALWGLGNVIALEHPNLRCMRIDLDPAESPDVLGSLITELNSDGSEDRVAWRAGRRYVARLVPRDGLSQPMRLQQTRTGVLDGLVMQPAAPAPPGPGEVTIRVSATGLNFRDVLNALGMYPGPTGPLGDECAGTIAAIGPGVTDRAIGDEVVGLASGSFSTHVNTSQTLVTPRPPQLTPEQAAAIPIAFLTAAYGLRRLARLAPGERVLIHAAAGGVGLAAVRLAQQAGAEVFATAGSPEKRAFLAKQGVPHVLDSRSLDFAQEVSARTGGRGVDVVLNSLGSEFIEASLRVLAPHGRFVELGKRDIWTAAQVAAVHPTAEYHVFDLGVRMHTEPAAVRTMLAELVTAIADGNLAPLPLREFAQADLVDAFRYMAQARHIGKLVVRGTPQVQVRAEATYLITGGLGALGLRVAAWLVEHGARHLLLLSRRGPGEAAQAAIRQLEAGGVEVVTAAADVSREADLAQVFSKMEQSIMEQGMPPLRGVVHAAGVLDDGVLLQQDRARFAQVLAPKAAGAWNLHTLTSQRPLDFFVLFSSIVSVAGAASQGGYAAANAFLDGLAHYRRSRGLPALSVNWGAWAETGMAAELSTRDRRRWTDQGIVLIPPELGLRAMESLLAQGAAQASVVPIDWTKFLRQFTGTAPPLYAELHRATPAAPRNTPRSNAVRQLLVQQLKEAVPNKRRPLLAAYIREQAVQVLGIDPAQSPSQALDAMQPLSELGLDSLMAVELRNALGIAVNQTLPVALLYDYPTIDALTDFLAHFLVHEIPAFDLDTAPAPERPPANGHMASLQKASEAEAEALLLKELEALNF